MRFFLGLIVGVLIAIGGAYIHDSMTATTMTGPDASGQRMVNWDVVSHSFNRLAADLRYDFDRLIGRPPRSDADSRGV